MITALALLVLGIVVIFLISIGVLMGLFGLWQTFHTQKTIKHHETKRIHKTRR